MQTNATRFNFSKWVIVFLIPFSLSLQSCAKEPEMTNNNEVINTNLDSKSIVLGMGCFWGAEKRLSEVPGVIDVESGYSNGDDANAGYKEVLGLEQLIKMGLSQKRNHAEVIKVTYNPSMVDLKTILIKFWENHNPTQGDRQGNDVGSNYRSAIYYQTDNEKAIAEETKAVFQQALTEAGKPTITTEIAPLKNYITAEEYHQDYLEKNPNGYCGLGGTGVAYPGSETKQHPRLEASTLTN